MKNLLMFFGDCGHTTVTEIDDEQWERWTTQPGYNAIGPMAPNRTRVGRKTRMVYVYPGRFCVCEDCFAADMMDLEDLSDGGLDNRPARG
jgi:hypothetical protein